MKLRHTVAIASTLLLCAGGRAQPADTKCTIEHKQAENGATVAVAMAMINDGTPCVMSRRVGGAPAESLRIRGRPVNGMLSSTRSSVSYTPNPGFVGKDAFDVQWFGTGFGPNSAGKNIRTRVDVTVRPKTDQTDPRGDTLGR